MTITTERLLDMVRFLELGLDPIFESVAEIDRLAGFVDARRLRYAELRVKYRPMTASRISRAEQAALILGLGIDGIEAAVVEQVRQCRIEQETEFQADRSFDDVESVSSIPG